MLGLVGIRDPLTIAKAGILADEELRGMDAYQWTICHAVRVDDPLAHTRIQLEPVDGRAD